MKRRILLFLLLAGTLFVSAQTFTYTGIDLQSERVRTKNIYEWENFVLLNYNYGINSYRTLGYHSVGITFGQVKLAGWYVSASVGFGGHYGYTYEADGSGQIYSNYSYITPTYTGRNSRNKLSITGGGIIRMVIPLYFYAGIGYGYSTLTAELDGGKWAKIIRAGKGHAMNFDLGFQGNIKGFTISVGYCALTDFEQSVLHEVKIGIGYTFKKN